MKKSLFLLAACLAAASSAGEAAVTYSYTSDFFHHAVTIIVPTAISAQTIVDPIYCAESGVEETDCLVLFDPIGSPAISFNGYDLPASPIYVADPGLDGFLIAFGPDETEFEGFATGAFLKNGSYSMTAGTLVVSGIPSSAPEPESWAMMLGGFGVIGGMLRTRRKAAVAPA